MNGSVSEPVPGRQPVAAFVDDLGAWLRRADVPHRIHAHAPLPDVAGALASGVLPFPPDAWVKTIAFLVEGGTLLLAGLRALDRLDYAALSKATRVRRAELRNVPPTEVEAATGWARGGVAPLPIRKGTRVVLDTALLSLSTIYCGAGRPDCTLELPVEALLRMSHAEIASIARR